MTLKFGITKLVLKNFRNHSTFVCTFDVPHHIQLIGPNGAGKTSLLEALSLFSPGKGLRKASMQALQRTSQEGLTSDASQATAWDALWKVEATLFTPLGPVFLEAEQKAQTGKRLLKMNGEPLKRQLDLQSLLCVVWMTPRFDLLLTEATAVRRRFFDRLFMTLDDGYAPLLLRYETNLKAWRLLSLDASPDPLWQENLERLLVQDMWALLSKRALCLKRLEAVSNDVYRVCMKGEAESFFEQCHKDIEPFSADESQGLSGLSDQTPPDRFVAFFKHRFQQLRHRYVKNMPLPGPQATCIDVIYQGRRGEQCSSGEQKTALLRLTLDVCLWHVQAAPETPLILLLDDFKAHLDHANSQHLMKLMTGCPSIQVWCSGTVSETLSGVAFKNIALSQQKF